MTELRDKDIAKMAIGIEEKGMMFYTRVADKFTEPAIKEIFLRLAEEEKEHQRTFQKLFDMAAGERVFDEDTAKYVRNLLDSSVFPPKNDMDELLNQIKSPRDALAIGVQAEKDAILFYHELYEHTLNSEAKNAISKLLEEEKFHLIEMREQMEEMA